MTTSSGAPAASPSTTRSRSSTKSSLPPAPSSMKAIRASRTAACSTRTIERSAGRSPSFAASGAVGPSGGAFLAMASVSRSTLVFPSFALTTATRSPCSSALSMRTSFPRDVSASTSASRTSARSSSRRGRGSPAAAPIFTASTRTPSRPRKVVFTAPISTGRSHCFERTAACSRATEVRIRSSVKAAATVRTTSTTTTAARIFGQRRGFTKESVMAGGV